MKQSLNEGMKNGIQIQTASVINSLEEIIKKAEHALKIIKTGQQITYTHSEINGIGSSYEELIRTIERVNVFESIEYFFCEKENK
jgi:hypothetical protein